MLLIVLFVCSADCLSGTGRSQEDQEDDICSKAVVSWSCVVCWEVGIVVRTTRGPNCLQYEGIHTSLFRTNGQLIWTCRVIEN